MNPSTDESGSVEILLRLLAQPVLGVILFLTGAQLALGSCDFPKDKGERIRALRAASKSTWYRGALRSMDFIRTLGLFVLTALAEIAGCYLTYLWLKKDASAWVLIPAVACLAVFAWLLALHPHAAGRVYAAYGGVYVGVALMWLWTVDQVRPTLTDWIGVGVCLLGMAIILFGPNRT